MSQTNLLISVFFNAMCSVVDARYFANRPSAELLFIAVVSLPKKNNSAACNFCVISCEQLVWADWWQVVRRVALAPKNADR